jgi:hypothetical protein
MRISTEKIFPECLPNQIYKKWELHILVVNEKKPNTKQSSYPSFKTGGGFSFFPASNPFQKGPK